MPSVVPEETAPMAEAVPLGTMPLPTPSIGPPGTHCVLMLVRP